MPLLLHKCNGIVMGPFVGFFDSLRRALSLKIHFASCRICTTAMASSSFSCVETLYNNINCML